MSIPTLFEMPELWAHNELARRDELGQFMTPGWVAQEILEAKFGDLGSTDLVLEPSCGTGAFLHAINAVCPHTAAVGVEIDAVLAQQARVETGRRVITGDFLTIEIDVEPTAVIGNMPYTAAAVSGFLKKAHTLLPFGGRAGFLMPVHSLSFAQQTLDITEGFAIEHSLVPRNIYPRIRFPLMFAMFTKQQKRKLIGFFLYEEAAALRQLRGEYRAIAERPDRQTWRAVVERALRELGGTAPLERIYEAVEHRRPSANRFWRDKIRQVCHEHMAQVSRGIYRLAAA